jgi:hypothetical protein
MTRSPVRARAFSLVLAGLTSACTLAPADTGADVPRTSGPTGGASPTTEVATAYPPPRLTEDALKATSSAIEQDRLATAASVGVVTPVTATDMITYTNRVLGLSFSYPRILGDTRFTVRAGETGFSWGIGFERFDALAISGRSNDFSEPRDGGWGDTLGFSRESQGRYVWQTVMSRGGEGELMDVVEVLQVDGREVVVFRLPPPFGWDENEPWPEHLAAVGNLDGEQFPGFIAIPRDLGRLPIETFRALLLAIRVVSPTEPVATTEAPW